MSVANTLAVEFSKYFLALCVLSEEDKENIFMFFNKKAKKLLTGEINYL
jgi:hypothetical protein